MRRYPERPCAAFSCVRQGLGQCALCSAKHDVTLAGGMLDLREGWCGLAADGDRRSELQSAEEYAPGKLG